MRVRWDIVILLCLLAVLLSSCQLPQKLAKLARPVRTITESSIATPEPSGMEATMKKFQGSGSDDPIPCA
ncbi:hypothetical protein [Paenibacillus aceti]|uniref:hypothetical protein n=1 Tax=Paenibacillus aceti TaxID=1820010 RepID=UPI001E5D75DF|nr:hypothetical protein [Paenibacillus aceti]